MRRFLLAIMIAILPLRGLMGDAMALSMVVMPAHQSESATAPVGMPCPDHAEASQALHHEPMGTSAASHAADPSDPASSGSSEHAHTSCDLCNGPAMSHPAPGQQVLPTVHGIGAGPVERFVSSEPQRGIKPPIS